MSYNGALGSVFPNNVDHVSYDQHCRDQNPACVFTHKLQVRGHMCARSRFRLGCCDPRDHKSCKRLGLASIYEVVLMQPWVGVKRLPSLGGHHAWQGIATGHGTPTKGMDDVVQESAGHCLSSTTTITNNAFPEGL
jgi:hypothetical protein